MSSSLKTPVGPPGDANALRVSGDLARETGDWPGAELSYAAYLSLKPNDAPAWVQYGHALKEQGKLDAAQDAYRRAAALEPDDPDALLQLAHALKLLDRAEEAAACYQASYERSPSYDAHMGLISLGRLDRLMVQPLPRVGTPATVLVDISDLFRYIEVHRALSGIQRVQAEVVRAALLGRGAASSERFLFVLKHPEDSALWALEEKYLVEIIEYLDGAQVEVQNLRMLVQRARGDAKPISAQAGQRYFVLGSFWGGAETSNHYYNLKKTGVLLGSWIHDIIPISNPELCDAPLVHQFVLSFGDLMHLADFVITSSVFALREINQFRERLDLAPIPIRSVPFGHALAGRAKGVVRRWTSTIAGLKDRPFVLMVSTIEARKNHLYILQAWRQFQREGLNPPDLVFVGRQGWRVGQLMDTIESWYYLDGKLHLFQDISDQELQTLYDACLFTVFPSLVEGWGLPVGESLAYGKPCVASSAASIPEVGGEFVDYIDPQNLSGGIEVLRRMVFDHDYRARREAEIRERFRPRDWADVGRQILEVAATLGEGSRQDGAVDVALPEGQLFRFGDLTFGNRVIDEYAAIPYRLALSESWYALEDWGVWMRGTSGGLRFRTPLAPGTEIVVYLNLRITNWATTTNIITVSVNGAAKGHAGKPIRIAAGKNAGRSITLRDTAKVDAQSTVNVQIRVDGEINVPDHPDTRVFLLGLISFGYARRSDAVTRAEIAEAIVFENLH